MLVSAAVAAALIPLSTASAAQAGDRYPKCDADTTPSAWLGLCGRNEYDDDPGGVSGDAKAKKISSGQYAAIRFYAKGEDFRLTNKTRHTAYFAAYYKRGGTWYMFFEGVKLKPGKSMKIYKRLSENRKVDIGVAVKGRGYVVWRVSRSHP